MALLPGDGRDLLRSSLSTCRTAGQATAAAAKKAGIPGRKGYPGKWAHKLVPERGGHPMRFGVGVAGVLGVALLLAPLARAADQTKIDAAVSAAARYIKQQQAADGSWPIRASNAPDPSMGATALCGLALVEAGKDAGVEPDRKSV